MTNDELIDIAKKASEYSYSPYSHFRVGAALECDDGTVFTGCNVENSSYGATCCAERTAVFSAAAKGYRKFRRIAIVGTPDGSFDEMTYPCGVCRQVLSEFCTPDFSVVMTDKSGVHSVRFCELMPHPFEL